jgi:GNAT superfamily N-acetyltransferase
VKYTVRRVSGTDHRAALTAMHTLTFPLDEHEDYGMGWWWLAFDEHGEPVAFAGMRPAYSEPGAVYLSRCGVLAGSRGVGLQSRLLRARMAYARALGVSAVVTTTYCNPASGNNLIKAGFRLYSPAAAWGSEGTCYWRITPSARRASPRPNGCTASASASPCDP